MKNEKLSVSGLKEFSKSLQHYLDYKNRIKESTDAMRFGTALHTAVLEPEKFDDEICVIDEIPAIKQIKKGWPKAASMKKMWLSVTLLLEEPKTVITKEQLEIIKSMHEAIFKHPVASQLIAKGKEKEIWLKGKLPCNHGDIDIHGKADVVHDGKAKICIDLKTIADATIDKIEYSIKEYMYHWQAYFYREMLLQERGEDFQMLFIFVDKTDKHNIQVIDLDEYWYTVAEEQIQPLLNDFYKYLAEGEEKLYKGYSNTIKTIKCPGWLKNKSFNSRFHEKLNTFSVPIVEFQGGKSDDNNNKSTVSNNEIKDVDIKKDTEKRKTVESGEVYEPETNKEVLDAVTTEAEKAQLPLDDVEAVLLVESAKLTGYKDKESALQCTIDKVCGPGVVPDSLDFKQKQKVLDELQKMQKKQAKAKDPQKKIKAPVQSSIDDELDF